MIARETHLLTASFGKSVYSKALFLRNLHKNRD